MQGGGGVELVAAVSEAGGLGSPAAISDEAQVIARATRS